MDSQTIDIPVLFRGVVSVKLPKTLKRTHALILANNLVLVRILATTENPNAPECDAFEGFVEETSISEEVSGQLWDNAEVSNVRGTWTSEQETQAVE